jgi:hypothetical protein
MQLPTVLLANKLVGQEGFEPSAKRLKVFCSTTELQSQKCVSVLVAAALGSFPPLFPTLSDLGLCPVSTGNKKAALGLLLVSM